MPVNIIARRAFRLDGQDVAPGDRVRTSAMSAVRLLTRGDARWPRRGDGPAASTSPETSPDEKPARRSRRRVLSAEDASESAKPRKRRTYKRRDLESEDA